MIENVEYTCSEEVCFCAQNMTFPCQSLAEGCHVSLSDLNLPIEEADVRSVLHAIHVTQTGANRSIFLSGRTCHGSGTLLLYDLKMVILWKPRIHQINKCVECANFLGQTS